MRMGFIGGVLAWLQDVKGLGSQQRGRTGDAGDGGGVSGGAWASEPVAV